MGSSIKLIIIGLLVSALLLGGCTSSPAQSTSTTDNGKEQAISYKMISAQEAKQMMDAGGSYIILDVRTVAEYQAQHIEGAVVIPVDEIKNRAASELPDKDMTILVYCRSGARAATASQALANMGYTHVYDFGGIMSWPYGTVSGS